LCHWIRETKGRVASNGQAGIDSTPLNHKEEYRTLERRAADLDWKATSAGQHFCLAFFLWNLQLEKGERKKKEGGGG
jgi:hypothetical protein